MGWGEGRAEDGYDGSWVRQKMRRMDTIHREKLFCSCASCSFLLMAAASAAPTEQDGLIRQAHQILLNRAQLG